MKSVAIKLLAIEPIGVIYCKHVRHKVWRFIVDPFEDKILNKIDRIKRTIEDQI